MDLHFAKAKRLPIFSVDNMQIINRCTHDPEILEGGVLRVHAHVREGKASVLRSVLHHDVLLPAHPSREHPLKLPILRPEILAAKPTAGRTCRLSDRRGA